MTKISISVKLGEIFEKNEIGLVGWIEKYAWTRDLVRLRVE